VKYRCKFVGTGDSCDGGISVLYNCLSWYKFVNTHLYHSIVSNSCITYTEPPTILTDYRLYALATPLYSYSVKCWSATFIVTEMHVIRQLFHRRHDVRQALSN